jgi:hypothetical protein
MSDGIPPIAPAVAPLGTASKVGRDELEYQVLELSKSVLTIQRAELSQRLILRWLAAVVGLLTIGGMAGMLAHVVHQSFWGPIMTVSPSFAVAMFVGPVLSITTITVALFVAAFRKFDEKDVETVGSGALNSLNMLRGQ